YAAVGVTALGTAALVGVPKIATFRTSLAALSTQSVATTTALGATAAAETAVGRGAGLAAIGTRAAAAVGPVGAVAAALTAVVAFADSEARKRHQEGVDALVGDPKKFEEAKRHLSE